MLYDLVAEYFGVENDHNLQSAVDASGISILDWLSDDDTPSEEARKRVVDAINVQTDKMIAEEIASQGSKQTLEDMLFSLSQIPGINVTGLPNRKARRKAKAKKKG